jgi:cyclopropane fatty-acyl-phospholipid synthase-like methyltransferase
MDVSPLAIERAEQRARQAGVDVQFHVADLASAIELDGPFDLVFDAGCYHCVRETQLPDLMRLVERSTRPGSHWLSLAGNANDPNSRDHGPPRVTAEEICREWEPRFELVQLREFFFDSSVGPEAYHPLAWSILGRRRGDGSSGA